MQIFGVVARNSSELLVTHKPVPRNFFYHSNRRIQLNQSPITSSNYNPKQTSIWVSAFSKASLFVLHNDSTSYNWQQLSLQYQKHTVVTTVTWPFLKDGVCLLGRKRWLECINHRKWEWPFIGIVRFKRWNAIRLNLKYELIFLKQFVTYL